MNDRLLGPTRLRPGFTPLADFAVQEWTAKLGFVAAGFGITLVPSIAARAARTDVALVALHPAEGSYRRIYAATAKARAKSPATEAFLAVLGTTASDASLTW